MFGRGYEELGSSDKGLILKNSGKVKIQWGKKFIDLLDSDGNLNVKLQAIIKPIKSQDDIKQDGFYFYDQNLIAKVGEEILVLTSNEGDTYVSFIEKQDVSSESKYIALQNIGFIYPSISDSNVYPTSGIIYVEESKSLFIIDNGQLTKYQASIPNPYTQQFVIAKDGDDNTRGALVIQGSGVTNGLQFDNLIIYSKDIYSILEASKEFDFQIGNKRVATISLSGIETESIYSSGANSNSGYRIYKNNNKWILDIDQINVRDGFDINIPDNSYPNNKITSKQLAISYFQPITETFSVNNENITVIKSILYNTNVNGDRRYIYSITCDNQAQQDFSTVYSSSCTNPAILEIQVRVIKCEIKTDSTTGKKYIGFSSSSTGMDHGELKNGNIEVINEPYSQIKRFRFFCYSDVTDNNVTIENGWLKFVDEWNNVLDDPEHYPHLYVRVETYPFGSPDGEKREMIEIHYMENENSSYSSSVCYMFSEKTLVEAFNNRTALVIQEGGSDPKFKLDLEESEITITSELGNLNGRNVQPYFERIHYKLGNINHLLEGYNPQNSPVQIGTYSEYGVFSGAEFREPLPLKLEDLMEQGVYNETPVIPTYNNCPKYSTTLQKALVKSQANTNNIIYDSTNSILEHENLIVPKKWIPQVANYIEDLTNSYTFDPNNGYTIVTSDKYLYDGKLFLFKIDTNNNSTITNGMTGRFQLVSIETNQQGQPVDRYSSWLYFYYEGTTVPFESEFCNGATLLVQLKLSGNHPGLYILFEAYPPGIKNFYNKVFGSSNSIDSDIQELYDVLYNNGNLIGRVLSLEQRVTTLENALNIQNSSS